jgi:signal transduction histidine kinase
MGRTLIDQDRVLKQFLFGLFILGSISGVLLGVGSWYLSGRSIGPAQRAWDQQQAFVSNASHELRTPLTLIRASAEVGLRSQPTGEQGDLWQDILSESDYMNRLVDDLLLLSRLDTHRLKLVREQVSLPELLQEIAYQAEKLIGEKGIKIEIGKASGMIWADQTRMRQVLLILIDNALRFTPAGGSIRLETVARHKTHQIIVSDNGTGISPDHLAHLFERFYQINPTGEALTRSNGLGLSIAKGIIEAQGGEIHVESQVGVGTRVVLELPAVGEALPQ